MRYANKRDKGHAVIVEGLRAVGATVVQLFDVDLAVSFGGRAYLMELKSPDMLLKRSTGLRKGALREKQKVLQEMFGPSYVVCTDLTSALTAIGYYE